MPWKTFVCVSACCGLSHLILIDPRIEISSMQNKKYSETFDCRMPEQTESVLMRILPLWSTDLCLSMVEC